MLRFPKWKTISDRVREQSRGSVSWFDLQTEQSLAIYFVSERSWRLLRIYSERVLTHGKIMLPYLNHMNKLMCCFCTQFLSEKRESSTVLGELSMDFNVTNSHSDTVYIMSR